MQRQLAFQIGDLLRRFCHALFRVCQPLRLFGDLSIAVSHLATQAINFSPQRLLLVRTASSFQPRHASHSTPIASICTVEGSGPPISQLNFEERVHLNDEG